MSYEYCDDEHSWEQVDVNEWNTGRDVDDEFQTVIYECEECDAKRWEREEKVRERSVFDW